MIKFENCCNEIASLFILRFNLLEFAKVDVFDLTTVKQLTCFPNIFSQCALIFSSIELSSSPFFIFEFAGYYFE